MDRDLTDQQAVESLLTALAIQAGTLNDARFADAAIEQLAMQSRAVIVSMLAHIGHLVHYGADFDAPDGTEDWLTELFERLLAAVRRRGTGALLPGDVVEFVEEDRRGRLSFPRRVYFVGTDGTADVGYASLRDDYTVSTVGASEIRVITTEQ